MRSEVVPVGEDQLPHLELAREIVRRFNEKFGETFPEPQARLTEFPIILGLDGKEKMSKSQGNYIEISATPEETKARVMTAVTDVSRKLRSDIGHPEVCNVFTLQQFFSLDQIQDIEFRCRKAAIGCVQCKEMLAQGVNRTLAPIRERRAELAKDPQYIKDVLSSGAKRAQAIARVTLEEVKRKMGLM